MRIIYILPHPISEAIKKYYLKLMTSNESVDVLHRVRFIVPEYYHFFPKEYPLTKLLYYSSRTIQQIKRIVGDNYAYLVTGQAGETDYLLAHALHMPLYQGNLQLA